MKLKKIYILVKNYLSQYVGVCHRGDRGKKLITKPNTLKVEQGTGACYVQTVAALVLLF